MLKTVQLTLDNDLVAAVDEVVKQLGTTRSAFARDALWAALAEIREKEVQHQHGYRQKPVSSGEFSDWEDEQVWVEP